MAEEQVKQSSFMEDSMSALLNPMEYFASLKTDRSMGSVVLKAFLYGLISGIFYFIWGLLGIAAAGKFGGIMAIITYPIGAIIGLFIGAIIVLIISAISKGNTDFTAAMHVTASIMVLMPLGAILGFLYVIGPLVVTLVTLLINLYGLYMLFIALKLSLHADEKIAQIVIIVLVIIVLLLSYSGYKAQQYVKELQNNLPSSMN